MSIVNLRDVPHMRAVVADRIWRAWWQPDGAALADVEQALGAVLDAHGFPFNLVATEDDKFLGTVTAIASDLAARPDLSPWIAALWVEPHARGRGIARELMRRAFARLAVLGHSTVYLCAKPELRNFYQNQGWALLEATVGPDGLDVFSHQTETTA